MRFLDCKRHVQGGVATLDRSIFKRMLAAASPESGEQESVAGSESLWADLILQLTGALQRSLPPVWQLVQVRFRTWCSEETAEACELLMKLHDIVGCVA